jgi:aspartate/methionine/tyrosine aminotransferase
MTAFRVRAPYMEWAKNRPAAKYDLAGSNILACSIADLPGAADTLGFQGRNDDGYGPLLEAIARRYAVSSERVTTAQGTSGANFLVCAALLEPGDEVLVETPGYDPLFAAPQLIGARVNYFGRDFAEGFAVDPERVRHALTARTRLIVLTSPHNPSGVIASREALEEIGRIANANDAHVLVDEVYLDASSAALPAGVERAGTCAHLGGAFICTSSLTKSYGLSGLRCGWVISSPEVARRIRRARDVVDGTGSIVAERLAVLAFEHIDRLLERATDILETNGAIARAFLRSRAELDCVAASGTVVFPRLRDVADSSAFAERLLFEHHTAVVPGRFFQSPEHFRVGIGGQTDTLRAGLDAIAAALAARSFI